MDRFRHLWTGMVLLLCIAISIATGSSHDQDPRTLEGTIAVSSTGRSRFTFDVFYRSINVPSTTAELGDSLETRLTDGTSVNYNGQFVGASERQTILDLWAKKEKNERSATRESAQPGSICLAYVSERNGFAQVHFDILDSDEKNEERRRTVSLDLDGEGDVPFQDRPSVASDDVVYVGMRERSQLRQSWTAIFARNLTNGKSRILSPSDGAEFSHSVSPSGDWVIVASDQRKGFQGEICNVNGDLYIFKAADGSDRRLLVEDGGWPSWVNDSKFFFHKWDVDNEGIGWWSVYEGILPDQTSINSTVKVRNITGPGFHAFTPAASRDGKWLAVATRRPGEKYRHIEILDLEMGNWRSLTKSVDAHHYNPFVSPDSTKVGYHRCRFAKNSTEVKFWGNGTSEGRKNVEKVKSRLPKNVTVVRVDGDFASFSPDGSLIATNPNVNTMKGGGDVYVMALNGSWRTQVWNAAKAMNETGIVNEGCHTFGKAFGTAWNPKNNGSKGTIYTSLGGIFLDKHAEVHILAISVDLASIAAGQSDSTSYRLLTKTGTSNNGLPSPSPDGMWLVFRSSRCGHFNLFIMHALSGEDAGPPRQLTNGSWTDTMPTWSPDGEWISFASDRKSPGSLSYSIYLIRPNGADLRELPVNALHPHFSPDSKSLVFATDYAGLAAEPISVPQEFQPYGEIYISDLHGSSLRRLTFSPYETSLPSWGRITVSEAELSDSKGISDACSFPDDLWLDSNLKKQSEFCRRGNLVKKCQPRRHDRPSVCPMQKEGQDGTIFGFTLPATTTPTLVDLVQPSLLGFISLLLAPLLAKILL